ncbi:DUF736 domain-containing protein [Komagataeibacter rhaeticus]
MANIGSFKKVGEGFEGEIVTLALQARNVRLVAETNRANDNAPNYRVYLGRVELGAAWTRRSSEGRDLSEPEAGRSLLRTPRSSPTCSLTRKARATRLIWTRPRSRATGTETPHDQPRPVSPGGAFRAFDWSARAFPGRGRQRRSARRETQEEHGAFPQPSHCTMREGEPRQGRVVPPILPDAPCGPHRTKSAPPRAGEPVACGDP